MNDHRLWRIGADTPNYTAEDSSGKGAEATGGRWNRKGIALLYTSESIALACLETLVHLNAGSLPLNRYLVNINVPANVWRKRETLLPQTMIGWDAEPAGRVSLNRGSEWVKSNVSLCACVPSVVVPEEWNVLINPKHPDAVSMQVVKVRNWSYDHRLE